MNTEEHNKEEKWKKRQERYERQDRRRQARQNRRDKNIIAIIGLIVSANAFILSFTGWFVWLALVGIVLCLIGVSRKRPADYKKMMALIGLGLGFVAIINAVRVSNSWLVTEDALPASVGQAVVEAVRLNGTAGSEQGIIAKYADRQVYGHYYDINLRRINKWQNINLA